MGCMAKATLEVFLGRETGETRSSQVGISRHSKVVEVVGRTCAGRLRERNREGSRA